jgi:dipeptidyl aminopeptidase/acylaminoacyl peptidase
LSTHRYHFLTSNIPWDIDEFDLSFDGHTIAFVANQDGIAKLHLLDIGSGKERPVPKLPVGVISDVRFHKNNRDLAFTLVRPRQPRDAYSLDVTTGKLQRWTFSETGGLDASGFSEPQLIHWKSFDGRSISGFLYRPPARFSGKRPVMIEIHGGPESQWRPDYLGEENYLMNELGVVLIAPNVRGSTGYGKSFQKLDNGMAREGSYKDIGTLLEWITSQPDLDASRIMITGGSYGGHMTLATSYLYSDLIRCSVDVVGMSNLVTFLEHTSPYRHDLRRVEYGDERKFKTREFLERIAPLNNAAKIAKPLFVVAGYNDPRVPYTEAQQMVAKVRSNGVPVWFLMAKDEGHGFGKKKNRDFEFYATVLFMQEYLLK